MAACACGHVIATRLSWAGIPLQTDTGMWAYIGGRIVDGALPYRDLWESKPPGIYCVFAAVEFLFGRGQDQALLWLDAVLSLAVLGATYSVVRRFASRVSAAGAVLLLSLVFCHRVLADWGDNVEKFVALFEMLACWLALRGWNRASGNLNWLAAGVCCGLAGLFKQTGVVFLVAAVFVLLGRGLTSKDVRRQTCRRVGVLILGAVLPWLAVVCWMMWRGIFAQFWQQVILYDLIRVGSDEGERSRLSSGEHWSMVLEVLKLALIVMAPAAAAALHWLRRRMKTLGERQPAAVGHDSQLGLVVLYWLLATLLFPLAPYGYGHYVLQAAPPAAVLSGWLLDRTLVARQDRSWRVIWAVMLVVGLWALQDHFRFTFDRTYDFRRAYAARADLTKSLVSTLRSETAPGQSVMLWPPDYAVSYYARRTTPLEGSNSDVIFKDKIARLRPPMPELLARLQAAPPDVIVDWTPVGVEPPAADRPDAEPHLLTPAGGFSLADEPDEEHPVLEGRMLAPLKRWVQSGYGGQRRIGPCTVYYRGRPWRRWQEVLLPAASNKAH